MLLSPSFPLLSTLLISLFLSFFSPLLSSPLLSLQRLVLAQQRRLQLLQDSLELLTARNSTLSAEKRQLARARAESQAEADAVRELALARMASLQRRAQESRRLAAGSKAGQGRAGSTPADDLERLQDENSALHGQLQALEERLQRANRDVNAGKAAK